MLGGVTLAEALYGPDRCGTAMMDRAEAGALVTWWVVTAFEAPDVWGTQRRTHSVTTGSCQATRQAR